MSKEKDICKIEIAFSKKNMSVCMKSDADLAEAVFMIGIAKTELASRFKVPVEVFDEMVKAAVDFQSGCEQQRFEMDPNRSPIDSLQEEIKKKVMKGGGK